MDTKNKQETQAPDISMTGLDITDVPEKFRDPETGLLKIDALLNSYKELERKLSTMMPRPDSKDAIESILKIMGKPDTPDAYDVDTSHGLFDVDPDINRKLYEYGFTLEQVQAVYDLAAEKFVPMVLELAQDFQADREVERLVKEFGGEEKWTEISRQLLAYGQKNLPEEVLRTLASSYEGVMALYRMMKGEDGGRESIQIGADEMPSQKGENDLSAMMRDPRYWRDRDPNFVSKVTEGFERLYKNK